MYEDSIDPHPLSIRDFVLALEKYSDLALEAETAPDVKDSIMKYRDIITEIVMSTAETNEDGKIYRWNLLFSIWRDFSEFIAGDGKDFDCEMCAIEDAVATGVIARCVQQIYSDYWENETDEEAEA